MKKLMGNTLFFMLALLLLSAFVPAVSFAAPAVSAECAYSANDVVCEIYVNTDGNSLISGGVKLTYNATELSNPVATKNDAVWYFGAGGPEHDYMLPETSTSGEVVFIVGKMDSGSAAVQGVNGTRVKVGDVTFTRATNTLPVTDPGTLFNINASIGRPGGTYANFVNTAGDNLDAVPVTFSTTVAQRGDANASGSITSRDLTTLRSLIQAGDYVVYADCNASGTLTSRDLTCIRSIIQP